MGVSSYNVLCWSGGKDSSAVIPVSRMLGIHIDEIVMAEVMYDNSRGIPNESPCHYDWCHNVAAPIFEEMGIKVTFIRSSEHDFLSNFHHVIEKAPANPEHEGLEYGFPLFPPRCTIRRDCKTRPLDRYIRQLRYEHGAVNVLDGMAADEKRRVETAKRSGRISILAENHVTEDEARDICKAEGLLSPLYSLGESGDFQKRGGCWNCPCCKDRESLEIIKTMPDIWDEYVSLEDSTKLAFPKWNIYSPETLHERDQRLKNILRTTNERNCS